MRHHELHTSVVVPAPLDRVFAFFSDARNLEALTPPELRFRILTPLPIDMRTGALIDYSIGLWGVPMRWRTLISAWEPPHRFVDVQLRGPYAEWVHTHSFESAPDGGTRITDHVRYALPFWPLGLVALPLVRRQVRRIFSYRETRIRELLPR